MKSFEKAINEAEQLDAAEAVSDAHEQLQKALKDVIEELQKGGFPCVRCGKGGQSSKGARCGKCMSKLTKQRKTPGHYQRAQRKADSALRRQDGKNGTASKKSSGRGSRKAIVKQHQAAEKRTGQKLSPDRKNNSKGYSAKNVRSVPEKLNRGRHKVDTKKLAAWRKNLKKSDISFEDFKAFLLLKVAKQNNTLLEMLIKNLTQKEVDSLYKED